MCCHVGVSTSQLQCLQHKKYQKQKEYPVLNSQKDYNVYYINTDIVVKRPLNLKITTHYLLNEPNHSIHLSSQQVCTYSAIS